MEYLIFQANPLLFAALLFVVMGLSIELPYKLLSVPNVDKRRTDAFNVVQAGLLTLTSFVIGLSFAQASGRFDLRRELVVKEANAIGTTWLRAGQLPSRESTEFRRVLTAYTLARLTAYETPNDPNLTNSTLAQSDDDQSELWQIASAALRKSPSNQGYSLLLQSLNDTIDVSAEQLQALTTHVPTAVLVLTMLLVVVSALSLGLRFGLNKSRPPGLTIAFAIAYVLVVNMMIDYDRPQTGFVKVNLNPLRVQLETMQQPR
ncbi:MAG TPA: hypothetical protein VHS56_14025 [Candidatus Cybelea sp.]|nr:hypothetical protein [Candidatus Cybelea sp.]